MVEPAHIGEVPRKIYLLQRKTSKVGDSLGKTTGWIHRTGLKNRGVEMIPGVQYRKIDDAGLHITVVGDKDDTLPVDNVIVCAGQDPNRELQAALEARACGAPDRRRRQGGRAGRQARHQARHRAGAAHGPEPGTRRRAGDPGRKAPGPAAVQASLKAWHAMVARAT